MRKSRFSDWKWDYDHARPHSALGYLTDGVRHLVGSDGCGKAARSAGFLLSHSLDDCGSIAIGVESENPNPEKVSLSVG